MVQKAILCDAEAIAALAFQMWDTHSVAELTAEFQSLICKEDSAVFLCKENNHIIGFAQCGLRYDYVEGTQTSPVGYLEGVFVEAPFRHRGHGKELVSACEMWAKEKGCTEFASDCELSNTTSLLFHQKCGFLDVNRIICFTKTL